MTAPSHRTLRSTWAILTRAATSHAGANFDSQISVGAPLVRTPTDARVLVLPEHSLLGSKPNNRKSPEGVRSSGCSNKCFPWSRDQTTGSRVAASITSGAASNAAISLSAALSVVLRVRSELCGVSGSIPRTAANSCCDRLCRARTSATRSGSARRPRYTRTSSSNRVASKRGDICAFCNRADCDGRLGQSRDHGVRGLQSRYEDTRARGSRTSHRSDGPR